VSRKPAPQFFHVRNLRGSWPEWYVDLDNGGTVYARIRHGCGYIGVGKTPAAASRYPSMVGERREWDGVVEAVDALLMLREFGYHYVPPFFVAPLVEGKP